MNLGLLLYPGCLPTGLFAASDLLLAANLRLGRELFRFQWLSPDGRPVASANGPALPAEPLGDARLDALLIPGAWRDADHVPAPGDDALAAALASLDHDVRLLSYCTGVCLVAAAGKLDDHPATTTWWLASVAGKHWPKVHWKLTETAVHGPRHATASGVNGHLPLTMRLIEEYGGTAVAEDIHAAMVLPRPGRHHTPFQTLTALLQQSPLIRRLVHWVEATPATDLTLPRAAAHLHLTERTLARRLKTETGDSAAHLIRLIKFNQVSDRLLTSTDPVGRISDLLGFADDTTLRRGFKRLTGLTPAAYRRRYG